MPVRPARVLGFPRVLCVWCVPRVPFARLRGCFRRLADTARGAGPAACRRSVSPYCHATRAGDAVSAPIQADVNFITAEPRGLGLRCDASCAAGRALRAAVRAGGGFDGRAAGRGLAGRTMVRSARGRTGRRAIRVSGACDERGCPAHVEGAGVRRGRKARAKSAGGATRTSRAATHRSDPFRGAKQPPVRRSETLSFSCRTAGRLRRRGPVRCTHVRSAACPATRRTASRPDARSGTPRRPRGPRRARGT
ncbi:hypothetical protein C7405_11280 [Paraburkholderia caballeronis]|nr:hypothetical protein C7405_11280 [Paraburkholderia caballeronis]